MYALCHTEVNMKALLIVLLVAVSPALLGAAPAPNEVVLMARDVISARDIEEAIKVATNYGTRPGIVTLDARDGPFTYDHPDKSINIFYSGETLRSLNGATITNCDDGVFFDDFPLQDVAVEGITFRCVGGGVQIPWARYECRSVVIRGNTFDVEGVGIGITLGRHVTIFRNSVAGADAIRLHGTTGATVTRNDLRGRQGVLLDDSGGNRLTGNRIRAEWQGVLLVGSSGENEIEGNSIRGVQAAGVAFIGNGSGNKVHGNRVTCAPGAACLAVDAPPSAWETNRISGNRLAK